MKISQFIFLFLLSFFCVHSTNAQTWTSYQSPEEINSLLDTGTELLMGTKAGLVVMNKSTMQKTLYNTSNTSLGHNEIVAVAEAPNGDIWVATKEGTIEQFNGTNFQNATAPNHVDFDNNTEVFDLKIGPNGDFWCGTNDGLFHKQGTTWINYAQAAFGAGFFELWDIAINASGEVFAATNDAFKFSNGVWTNIIGSSTLQNYLDADLFISSTGDLFMSGDLDNIGRFDGTQWTEYAAPGSSGWRVQGFTEDTNGDIYVSTISDGIYKLIANDWVKEDDVQTQAMGDDIAHVHIDSQNKRWLNSSIYLSVMDGTNLQNTQIIEHTLETNSVRKVVKGDNGKMYFMTYSQEHIAMRDAADNWSFLEMPPLSLTLSWQFYNDLFVISDTNIWLSSNQGLYYYDGTTWTKPVSIVCREIVADSQGKIYVRSDDKILVIDNGVMSEYNTSNSPITNNEISGLGLDINDNLWLSHTGTNVMRKLSTDGTWTEYTPANHPQLNGTSGKFHGDVNGNLWMLSNGVGVIKFDGTSFVNIYDGNIGQMSNYDTYSITSDATGKMFFSHQYGITTWDNGQWGEFLIDDVPHIASSHYARIASDDAGNIWWGSERYGVFALSGAFVLPVDLTEIAAETVSENTIELTWQTASEINNDYFSIEHSTDGNTFREISKEHGSGTTINIQNYIFLHENLAAGQHYYRLKQVDFDGRFEYSDIVTARIRSQENGVSLMPNPTTGIINIQTDIAVTKDTDLQIINAQGQIVFSNSLASGAENLTVDISDLPRGIYYLRMAIEGDLLTKKIVKE